MRNARVVCKSVIEIQVGLIHLCVHQSNAIMIRIYEHDRSLKFSLNFEKKLHTFVHTSDKFFDLPFLAKHERRKARQSQAPELRRAIVSIGVDRNAGGVITSVLQASQAIE